MSILSLARELAKFGPVLPVRGKLPMWKDWPNRATREVNGDVEWQDATGVGLLTGARAGFFVLDVDGAEGVETLKAWNQEHGKLPVTPTVRTGSGGYHFYFKHPGFPVRSNARVLGKGIDVRGEGGQVVAAGSKHPSGTVYAWAPGRAPHLVGVAEAPPWLLDKLRPVPVAPAVPRPIPPMESAEKLRRASAYLAKIPGAVSRAGGHLQTFKAALVIVRGFQLSEEEAFALLASEYNPRCDPPWSEKELRHKVEGASRDASVPWGYLLDTPALNGPRLAKPSLVDDDSTSEETWRESPPLTDSGNGELFAEEHGADVRHCRPLKKWLVWNGKQWKADDTGEVERRAKNTVRALYRTAAEIDNKEVREATAAWARKSESAARREAMLQLARAEEGIFILPDDLDSDPYVFNVENGTIDLGTGELLEHSRDDLITKIAPVVYDPAAKCPAWEMFLERIIPDDDTRGFLQRAIGYSLTGDTSAEALFVLYGKGANGKSTLTGAIHELHGDYARSVNPELLLASRNDGGANKASPDLLALRGVRFALCAETEEGRTLAAAMVKRTCSTDKIAARGMYVDSCEFSPSHKLFLMTNHRPRVRSADAGTWRRIFLIPFTVSIPEKDQDKGLRDKLRAELPGILAWAVRGGLDWQKRGGGRAGLAAPASVLNATKDYREEEDAIAPFLADACTLEPGASVTTGALYEAYRHYAEQNKETPEGSRTFSNRIAELDGVKKKRTGEARLWLGIGLRGRP